MKLVACALAALVLLVPIAGAAEPPPKANESAPVVRAPGPEPWLKPRVLVRVVFDPPYGIGAGAMLFLVDRWSVSADLLNRGAFGPFYELGVHFWPRAPRGVHHQLGVGVGGDMLATHDPSSGGFAALFLSSVDIHYLARPFHDFGFVAGGKAGFGVAFEARDFGDHARGTAVDHLGFQLTTYAGFCLGSRR